MRITTRDREIIAVAINAGLPGDPTLTSVDVFEVEIGINRTKSHPVWQAINRAINEHLFDRPLDAARPRR